MDDFEEIDFMINGRPIVANSHFLQSYGNFRDGIHIDFDKSKRYGKSIENINRFGKDIDETIKALQSMAGELEKEIENYRNDYYPTHFALFDDSGVNYVDFEVDNLDEFNWIKKNNLVWLNNDEIEIHLIDATNHDSYLIYEDRKIFVDDDSEIKHDSLLISMCDFHPIAYEIEKEINDEYVRLCELNGKVIEELYQLSNDRNYISSSQKPENSNSEVFVKRFGLRMNGNYDEFIRAFLCSLSSKTNQPFMTNADIDIFIRQNFDNSFNGEFVKFKIDCCLWELNQFATILRNKFIVKADSEKLITLLKYNFTNYEGKEIKRFWSDMSSSKKTIGNFSKFYPDHNKSKVKFR